MSKLISFIVFCFIIETEILNILEYFLHRIICPEGTSMNYVPSLWSIMSKVRFEAFLWGTGTALGELPPYFMAKVSYS